MIPQIKRRGKRGSYLHSLRGSGPRLPLVGFLALATVGLLLLPIAYLILRTLQADARAWSLILSTRTLVTLGRTIALALSVTGISAFLAVLLGWLTARSDLPLRRLWTVLLALPLVIPSYVGAYLLVAAAGPRGILAHWLEAISGLPQLPSIYGFPGALIVLTLLSYPFSFISVRAAFQGLDPALEEAARTLGLGPWRTFWRVTWPHLRPALVAGSLLVALYVLRDFGAVAIMRYDTFTRVIYLQYQSTFDRSTAAGLSLVLVLLTLLVLALEVRTRQGGRLTRSTASGDRRAPPVQLGPWRWPAIIFCTGLVALALLLPMGVLSYWLARGLRAGQGLGSLWQATQGSLLASGLATGVILAGALAVAIFNVRSPGRLSQLAERLSYTAFALPGIVIALALVFLGANLAPGIYQTLPMLILAYLILFLPQAVGSVRTSLLQVPPSLEDAGRSLGRRPGQVFRAITLPLLRSGLLAAAALVFLTTMKELPATLILSPFGFRTLATAVWSAVSEAFFAQAAAPALILILVSSVPMAWIVLRDQHD